jgi:hypothetical protein
MERGRITIRAIRPNKRMNLWVQTNLVEELRVTERPEKGSSKNGLEIDFSHDAVTK